MRLKHEEVREILPEYVKGSLTGEIKDCVTDHLRECNDCSGEASFLSTMIAMDVPDPGELFWKTLPKKVKGHAREERAFRFSLKSLLFRQMPVAAAVAILLFLVFTYAKKNKAPELDPLFKDPFAADTIDYSDITEKDIPLITGQLADDEIYLQQEDITGYSYHREFASLSQDEIEGLYEALEKEQEKGG